MSRLAVHRYIIEDDPSPSIAIAVFEDLRDTAELSSKCHTYVRMYVRMYEQIPRSINRWMEVTGAIDRRCMLEGGRGCMCWP
jgi:hypothetical protein